jgi:hypothetical protein
MRTRMHQEAFPRRGHLQSTAAGRHRAVLALAVRPGSRGDSRATFRRTATGRTMASAGVVKEFALPSALEAAEPPEARGLTARRGSPPRVGRGQRRDRTRAFQRSAPMARPGRSAGDQHQRHDERGAPHDDARRRAVRAARLDTIAGRLLDSGVAGPWRGRITPLPSGACGHDPPTSRRWTGDTPRSVSASHVPRRLPPVCGWQHSSFPMAFLRISRGTASRFATAT